MSTPAAPHDASFRAARLGRVLAFWPAVAMLSGLASILAVRSVLPAALDDAGPVLVLFVAAPAALIILGGLIHRALGVALAAAAPAAWCIFVQAGTDHPLAWAIAIAHAILLLLLTRLRGRTVAIAGVGVAGLALLVWALLWPGPGRPAHGPRLVLIGLDGATWDLIDPLTESGEMPVMAHLKRTGHTARLRSLPSLYSPRVWSTIATGCLPDDHGIRDFRNVQADFQVGRIWDRLHSEQRSIGTCGWYFTWPPLSGLGPNDFVIPSFLAPDGATHPPEHAVFWEISRRLVMPSADSTVTSNLWFDAFRKGVRVSTIRFAMETLGRFDTEWTLPLDRVWRAHLVSLAVQTDLFTHLVRARRPEFATLLLTETDKTSHRYWKFIEPEGFEDVTEEEIAVYGSAIDDIYRQVDRCLGKILRALPTDTDLMIVSDHGFNAAKWRLTGRSSRVRTERLAEALGLAENIFGTNVDQLAILRVVNVTDAERERILDRLEAALSAAHLEEEPDRPLFTVSRSREEVVLMVERRGQLTSDALLYLEGRPHPVKDLIAMERGKKGGMGFSGEHHPDGIYLLSGPSRGRAFPTDSLHVRDVAPTLAVLLDLPFSPQWPGHPAVAGVDLDLVERVAYPPPSAASGDLPADAEEALKEKLRAIGYLE